MSTPQAPFAAPPPPAGAPQLNFLNVLQRMLAVSDKVSDLIFSPGRPPQVELMGELQPVEIPGLEKLLPTHTAGIARVIIGNHQTASENLEKFGSADLSFSAPGSRRFRVNIFMQRGTHAIVMRVIPNKPPQWSDYNLPVVLKEIAGLKNGIVLVTGPTGSGKSTTPAPAPAPRGGGARPPGPRAPRRRRARGRARREEEGAAREPRGDGPPRPLDSA